jgi:hypothetical protein
MLRGRPCNVSGAVPTKLMMTATVGARLIDAVVRPHGSSQVKAQPSKAMPMGPVKAHKAKTIRVSPRRHNITAMVSRSRTREAEQPPGPPEVQRPDDDLLKNQAHALAMR